MTGDMIEVLSGWYMQSTSSPKAFQCPYAPGCLGGELSFGNRTSYAFKAYSDGQLFSKPTHLIPLVPCSSSFAFSSLSLLVPLAASCKLGHEGLLCGKCVDGWYRARGRCLSCAKTGSSTSAEATRTTLVILLFFFLVLGTAIILFVEQPPILGVVHRKFLHAGRRWRGLKHLRQAATMLSGLFKIALSFAQCLGAISRLSLVKWPAMFIKFMETLNQLVPELFTIVPAECIAGSRLGFYIEMLATLLIPPILFAFSLMVVGGWRSAKYALKAARGALAEDSVTAITTGGRSKVGQSSRGVQSAKPSIVSDARLQTTNIFLLLCVYPMICRKTFAVFDCVEAGVDERTGESLFFLREDPVEQCFTFNHNLWATAAVGGVLLYCVGVPLGFYVTVRRFRARFHGVPSGDPELMRAREGVILLIDAYRDQLSYPEAASMLHKCFFTGLVLVVVPDTRVQVWVGASVSLFAFFLYLLSRPYRFHICDIFQGAALLQLLLTYITAFLFFDDNGDRAGFDDDSWLGVFLCGANSIGFVVLIGVGSLFIYRQSRNTNGLLRYARGGTGVRASHLHFNLDAKRLQHPLLIAQGTPLEFHIFLSHAWANAQDIMRVMKERLIELMPDIRVFLDVDDLKAGKGGEYVDQSTVCLIFATIGYFRSANCMRELLRAHVLRKPIITLLEPEGRHGGLTHEKIREELRDCRARFIGWGLDSEVVSWNETIACKLPTPDELYASLFENEHVILEGEWQRDREYQDVMLLQMSQALLRDPKHPKLAREVKLATSSTTDRNVHLPAPRGENDFHIYVSPHNPSATRLLDELAAFIKESARSARRVREPQPICIADKKSELGRFELDEQGHETGEVAEGSRCCEAMLVHLNQHTWSGAKGGHLAYEVGEAINFGVQLILAHEVPSMHDLQQQRRRQQRAQKQSAADEGSPSVASSSLSSAANNGEPAPSSLGTLHVYLDRGVGLKSADRNGLSDPYVRLTCDGVTLKSKTIKKTLDPQWEESFSWPRVTYGWLSAASPNALQLACWDYDTWSRDDPLGTGAADLRSLRPEELREIVVPLSLQGTIHGTIHVQVKWVPEGGRGAGEAGREGNDEASLARAPCGFDEILANTPSILKDAGVYDKIAIPMKGGVYRDASLAKLLGEIAAPKARNTTLNLVSLEDLERKRLEIAAEAATTSLRELHRRASEKKREADLGKAGGGMGGGTGGPPCGKRRMAGALASSTQLLGVSALAVASGARLRTGARRSSSSGGGCAAPAPPIPKSASDPELASGAIPTPSVVQSSSAAGAAAAGEQPRLLLGASFRRSMRRASMGPRAAAILTTPDAGACSADEEAGGSTSSLASPTVRLARPPRRATVAPWMPPASFGLAQPPQPAQSPHEGGRGGALDRACRRVQSVRRMQPELPPAERVVGVLMPGGDDHARSRAAAAIDVEEDGRADIRSAGAMMGDAVADTTMGAAAAQVEITPSSSTLRADRQPEEGVVLSGDDSLRPAALPPPSGPASACTPPITIAVTACSEAASVNETAGQLATLGGPPRYRIAPTASGAAASMTPGQGMPLPAEHGTPAAPRAATTQPRRKSLGERRAERRAEQRQAGGSNAAQGGSPGGYHDLALAALAVGDRSNPQPPWNPGATSSAATLHSQSPALSEDSSRRVPSRRRASSVAPETLGSARGSTPRRADNYRARVVP